MICKLSVKKSIFTCSVYIGLYTVYIHTVYVQVYGNLDTSYGLYSLQTWDSNCKQPKHCSLEQVGLAYYEWILTRLYGT